MAFKNKLDEQGNIIRNNTRLIANGYNKIEETKFDEIIAPVVRFESTWVFIAYSCYRGVKLYQMHIKSTFINGYFKEEIYV